VSHLQTIRVRLIQVAFGGKEAPQGGTGKTLVSFPVKSSAGVLDFVKGEAKDETLHTFKTSPGSKGSTGDIGKEHKISERVVQTGNEVSPQKVVSTNKVPQQEGDSSSSSESSSDSEEEEEEPKKTQAFTEKNKHGHVAQKTGSVQEKHIVSASPTHSERSTFHDHSEKPYAGPLVYGELEDPKNERDPDNGEQIEDQAPVIHTKNIVQNSESLNQDAGPPEDGGALEPDRKNIQLEDQAPVIHTKNIVQNSESLNQDAGPPEDGGALEPDRKNIQLEDQAPVILTTSTAQSSELTNKHAQHTENPLQKIDSQGEDTHSPLSGPGLGSALSLTLPETEETSVGQEKESKDSPPAAACGPDETLDNSTYQNLQHYSYTPFTFVDYDVALSKLRLAQPSSGRPSPRH
ncbi:NADH dehydrogenase [ubiquinone] flavoprotein 3, mitochondrial, partial [Discoglossus pictus]